MSERGRKLSIVIVAICLIFLVAGGLFYLLTSYKVEKVIVEGNVHYTNEQMQEMLLKGRFGYNTLYLSWYYKNREIKDIPFIQTIDVEPIDKKTIRIHVYEKAMAGYVECLGQFFYFDKDGMVVESSKIRTVGIPQVVGISFEHIILNDYLPIEDTSIFETILEITQLLSKYQLEADRLVFGKNYDLTIEFDRVRAKMGDLETLDEKCSVLREILPNLEGKSGELVMDNLDSVTFRVDTE